MAKPASTTRAPRRHFLATASAATAVAATPALNKLPIETALMNITATTEAILLIAKAISRSEGSNALTHLAGLIEDEAELLRQLVLGDECEAV